MFGKKKSHQPFELTAPEKILCVQTLYARKVSESFARCVKFVNEMTEKGSINTHSWKCELGFNTILYHITNLMSYFDRKLITENADKFDINWMNTAVKTLTIKKEYRTITILDITNNVLIYDEGNSNTAYNTFREQFDNNVYKCTHSMIHLLGDMYMGDDNVYDGIFSKAAPHNVIVKPDIPMLLIDKYINVNIKININILYQIYTTLVNSDDNDEPCVLAENNCGYSIIMAPRIIESEQPYCVMYIEKNGDKYNLFEINDQTSPNEIYRIFNVLLDRLNTY